MNAKRWSRIETVFLAAVLILTVGCALTGKAGAPSHIPPTATPVAPTLQAPELTILASGSGVIILEYQGAGVRCIIASDGAGVDMVCQSAPISPAQPTPDGPDKHQTQPQGLEANALEFPRAGDGTPVLAG